MRYAQPGRSGLIVSRLAFGAGSLAVGETLPGLHKTFGIEQADRLVVPAIDAGGITREDQLDDHLQPASVTLSDEAVARLDATTARSARLPGWMREMVPDPRTRALLGGA